MIKMIGMNKSQIADLLNCSSRTLLRHAKKVEIESQFPKYFQRKTFYPYEIPRILMILKPNLSQLTSSNQ